MKKITICDKEHKVSLNALSVLKYKNIFKKDIFGDVQIIDSYLIRQSIVSEKAEEMGLENDERITYISDNMEEYLYEFIEAITRLTWLSIYMLDNTIEEYEKWLSSIEKFKIDDDWIAEVAKLVVDCFC